MIFEQTGDFATLDALMKAYPSLFMHSLRASFEHPIDVAVPHSWDQEVREYAFMAVNLESISHTDYCTDDEQLKTMLDDFFEDNNKSSVLMSPPGTWHSLRILASLTSSVESFLHLCTSVWSKHFHSPAQKSLSKGESLRIRRALLRFQIYAQLFHRPGDWERRPWLERFFWTRFESIEVEEIKCVYALLYYVLQRKYSGSPIVYEPLEVDFKSCHFSNQRGLPLLRYEIVSSTPSTLAKSYVTCFVTFAYDGLQEVDRYNTNFFPSMSHNVSFHYSRPIKKRYEPSPDMQRLNFDLQTLPRPLVGNHRIPWILIGWCFWDSDRVETIIKHWDLRRSGPRKQLADLIEARYPQSNRKTRYNNYHYATKTRKLKPFRSERLVNGISLNGPLDYET